MCICRGIFLILDRKLPCKKWSMKIRKSFLRLAFFTHILFVDFYYSLLISNQKRHKIGWIVIDSYLLRKYFYVDGCTNPYTKQTTCFSSQYNLRIVLLDGMCTKYNSVISNSFLLLYKHLKE